MKLEWRTLARARAGAQVHRQRLPVPALPFGFWPVIWNVVGLLWVVAYLALVFGQWRAARLFAVLTFQPSVGFAVRDTRDRPRDCGVSTAGQN
jgi:hypothetical protein